VPSRPAPAPSSAPDAGIAKVAVLAGAALAVLGVAVALWSVLGRDSQHGNTDANPAAAANNPAPVAPAPAPQVPTAVPAAAAAAVQLPADGTARANEIRLRIDAQPAEARIFIAGAEFPNPTDASRPRSLDPVRIRVEALNYQALEQLAIFDQDRDLHFTLQKGHGTRELSALDAKSTRHPHDAPAAPQPVLEPAQQAPAPSAPAQPQSPSGIYQGPTGKIRNEF
jgi:hypothetical protein